MNVVFFFLALFVIQSTVWLYLNYSTISSRKKGRRCDEEKHLEKKKKIKLRIYIMKYVNSNLPNISISDFPLNSIYFRIFHSCVKCCCQMYVFIRIRNRAPMSVCTICCWNNFKIAEIFLVHYLNWSRLMTFSTSRVYSIRVTIYKGEGWREGGRWKMLAWSFLICSFYYCMYIQHKCHSYTLLIHNYFPYCHGIPSRAFSATQYRISSHKQKQRLQWLCRRCTKRWYWCWWWWWCLYLI